MVKAALFDFDGTLADSSEGIFRTALLTVRKLGITREYSDEELRRFVGPPLRDCFRIAFSLDEEYLDDALRIYREEYDRSGRFGMHLYPGMKETLEDLKAMGLRLGVASYKNEHLVKACLEYLGVADLFDSAHGSSLEEDLTKGDIIRMTLADLDAEGDEVVMIGDTQADLKGADEAGTLFVGVSYGFGFQHCDAENGILMASSPSGIVGIIRNMNGGMI